MDTSKISKRKAFTLAEVLVTLAIIGVVAALTIPSLIQNTQDSGNYAKFKKEVSIISQAVKQLEDQKGNIDFASDNTFINNFGTVISFLKKDTVGNLTNGIEYKLYKSSNTRDFSSTTFPVAILADGSAVAFDSLSATCTDTKGALTNVCGMIGVDVNSIKPPNEVGKDAFALLIVKVNGSYVVYPLGTNNDGYQCVVDDPLLANSSGCSMNALANSMP